MGEEVFAFGSFRLIPDERTLFEDGKPLRLGSRAFDVLVALIERAGETISKEELIARVWPDTVVEEVALRVHLAALRKALGGGRGGKRYIANLSGRGYAFIAPVRRENALSANGAPTGTTEAGNLPALLTRVIGRDDVISRLAEQLVRCRLVTIVGSGGIGKTTVAVAVAGRVGTSFKDGAWFVGLAPLTDPDLVPSAVGTALGVSPSDGDYTQALSAWFRDRNALLVLDNCEHVIDATAALAEAVLRAAPHTGILATSREPLRAEGERLHRLMPLELPPQQRTSPTVAEALGYPAVELFHERATATMDSFVLEDADVPPVLEICRRLDGLPLALELAAARVDTFGVGGLAARLDNSFGVLTSGGRRTALPRQQTLRAAIDWSYDLLPETERRLLRHFSVFAGGFTREAAAAVVTGAAIVDVSLIDCIADLVAKSLVVFDASTSPTRWRLLETIRAYALFKLAESGEIDNAQQRHAAYFRDLLASAVPDFRSRLPAENLIRYSREIDNVRAALNWSFSPSGDVAIGIDLTAAYAPVWMNLSLVVECRERCERALHLLDASTVNARLQMLLQLGLGASLAHTAGPSAQAQDILTRALETADILGDSGAQARALFSLQGVYRWRGEYGKAASSTERLQQIAQQIGDPLITAVADRYMGNTLITTGRLSEAQRYFERVIQSSSHIAGQRLPILRRESSEHAMARAMLARAFWLQGFAERAKNEAQASLDELQGADYELTICRVLYYGICRIAPMTGDFDAAERAIARMIEAAMSLNSRFWMTAAQLVEGKLMVERGAFAGGLVALRTAFATCSETGWRLSYPEFRGSLAAALGELAQLDEANDVVRDAITSAGGREDGQRWYVPELLRINAEILLRQSADRSDLAKDCLEQAATMAREQCALTWELRIALSLARLRVAQGRHAEAREALAPVYDRFTEGFATTDLRAAKALLDALR
ncbi:MAG: winged helix-turn-helix domain-containing protein [Alphaproteobacteria bacterium]|nr:winged helix-turn-helix domain-containing protein [Alphaproteobacteria bacterium]